MIVFHWSLSDSKSPQVSRTLLSILVNHNNAVVWMVWTFFLFSSLLVPSPILWWLYRAHQLQLVPPLPLCFIVFFSSLARSRYLSLFSPTFSFTLWFAGTAKSTLRQVLFLSFFNVDYHLVWSSDRDYMIRLYLKIQKNFVHLIFQDGFWVMHIPFVRMSHLNFWYNSHWISLSTPCRVSSCTLFTAFAFDVIDPFVSITT